MLRIIKSSDAITVDQIVVTIYAPPGVGKTSLGFTANTPLLLDFDHGAYRAANRGDSVAIKTWGDVASINVDDLKGYRTIVIDTAGRALDVLAAAIINEEPKLGRGGALTLQGYGKLKSSFTAFLKLLRSFGADVVLLAHADETKNGDEMVERIDAQGGSKNEIYKVSDAMGRLAIRNGKRVLLFSPTETAFGKNPAGMEPLPVPAFTAGASFLGDVIAETKETLNRKTAQQSEAASVLNAWAGVVKQAATSGRMNALLSDLATVPEAHRETAKKVLWSHAKDHGFVYDKAAKAFTEPVPAETPEYEAAAV